MAPLVSFLLFLLLLPSSAWQPNASHFLFIMFDDLRPELSVYGNQHMITPNFERLARKSVVFDYAFCQIAVCNPSRDSLLTGLRPDTVGTYGFQWSFRPNMIFPSLFSAAGYKTAGYGKILHWDGPDKEIWNYDQWENNWYEYQNEEWGWMNSSTMPDKIKPEEEFRDYQFTSRAIETMKTLHSEQQYFMVGLGFKLPHLQMHVPFKYFDMYRNKRHMWKRHRKDLKYPNSAPIVAHRCCASDMIHFMNKEGGEKFVKKSRIGNVDQAFSQQMFTELSWGYAAGVTFLDAQLGRVLDAIDEMSIWDNITIVLTSDHGMHNGEKGMWQKWSLFDESTRVPLMISHPSSPFQGMHYSEPVELVDIFPSLVDMFPIRPLHKPCNKLFSGVNRCQPLQGKSLAPVVLGTAVGDDAAPSVQYSRQVLNELGKSHHQSHPKADSHQKRRKHGQPQSVNISHSMPSLGTSLFAVSQNWRCVYRDELQKVQERMNKRPNRNFYNPFFDCNRNDNRKEDERKRQLCVMGYSFRYADYRYNIWVHWDRVKNTPDYSLPPFAEELYDHKGEQLSDFTRLEYLNLARNSSNSELVKKFRNTALQYLKKNMIFRGPYN